MINKESLDYLRHLPCPAHALLPFYDSESRDQAFLEYCRGATEQNRMILHLSRDPERDSRLLFEGGAKEKTEDWIRILPVKETFKKPVSVEGTIAFLKKATEDALRRGFSGLAESADATSALSPGLFKLEEVMGRIPPIESLTALCMYDTEKLQEQELIGLFSTHGHVIFQKLAGRLY